MKWNVLIPAALAVCSLMAMADLAQAADAPAAYKEHCASCHGEARLGGIGPALIPENLARLRKAEAEKSSAKVARRHRCRPSATS